MESIKRIIVDEKPQRYISYVDKIYIIDRKGTIIYYSNLNNNNSEQKDNDLISKFLGAFQAFANEMGEKEVKKINLGSKKFLFSIDHLTNILFVLECPNNVKSKRILPLLRKITNLFIEKFTGKFFAEIEEKIEIMGSFQKELDDYILVN